MNQIKVALLNTKLTKKHITQKVLAHAIQNFRAIKRKSQVLKV